MGFSGFNFAPLATEWSGGGVIKLGGLPGSTNSVAQGINNAGQAVGFSSGFNFFEQATEWSHGHVIDLGTGAAYGINDAGQAVGIGPDGATEWSHGSIIDLGGLPGSRFSEAFDINDAGQVVGLSDAMSDVGYASIATEWSHGHVIDLGGLPGSSFSEALGINNVGQVGDRSLFLNPSTWTMMLLGFAGLAFAGRTKTSGVTGRRFWLGTAFGSGAATTAKLVPHEAEQGAIGEMVALRAEGSHSGLSSLLWLPSKGHRISHGGVAGVLRAAGI